MSYYGYHSRPVPPSIEVGSEYVQVKTKYSNTLARILRAETVDGSRVLTLDRLLDRHAQTYVERIDSQRREWTATGAFVTVLTTSANVTEIVEE